MNNQTRNLTLQDLIQQLAARDERIRHLEGRLAETDAEFEHEFDERTKLIANVRERDERIRELEQQVTNLTSTVEAWNHAEIIKCGCKYNKVWGGMKWEHWLSPCKEHREREQQLKAAQERLALAQEFIDELDDRSLNDLKEARRYDSRIVDPYDMPDDCETTITVTRGELRKTKEYFAKHSNEKERG